MASKNSYVNKQSQTPFDFVDITYESLLSKNVTFDKTVTFTNKVLFDNTSDKVTFKNTSIFDNDVHVTNINFGGDVKLNEATIDRDSKTSMISNAERVNQAFTDDYIGGWKNEEYVIDRLKIKDMEDSELTCSGPKGIKSKSACVSKMWTTLRDAKSLDSAVCDCCCTKKIIPPAYCMVKLIDLNGNEIVLKADDMSKPQYYNITSTDKIHAVYLTRTEGVGCIVRFFNIEKRVGDTSNHGEMKKMDTRYFKNTLMSLNHLNLHPHLTRGWIRFKRYDGTIYIKNQKYDAQYDGDLTGNPDLELIFDNWNISKSYKIDQHCYIKTVKGGYYLTAKDTENNSEDDSDRGGWVIKWQEVKSDHSNRYYKTGYFWIVSYRKNKMFFLNDEKETDLWDWWEDEKTLWSFESSEGTLSNKMVYTGVKLELESVPTVEDSYVT